MNHFHFYIDRGGTFTDIYCEIVNSQTNQTVRVVDKLLSEATHYPDGPSEGIKRIFHQHQGGIIKTIVMGTTIVTNAILERKGAHCALLVTKGFKDILKIGTQSRPEIFDLKMERPEPLYSKVIEVDARVSIHQPSEDVPQKIVETESGEKLAILKDLDEEEVSKQLEEVEGKYESLAVLLLHSSVYPQHEEQIKKVAGMRFGNVSLSSEVSKVIKAVPRGLTAVLDAYTNPLIGKYLEGFRSNIGELGQVPTILFMMSDGGLCEGDKFYGSKALLSGPAGGVVGMIKATRGIVKKVKKVGAIGFDMGGTSTDVSVYYPGKGIEISSESTIAGIQVNTPCFDISTVAAGGGSVLTFQNGLFKVGPESSGALPGPVCYGRNGRLSVTDANLFLGRIKVEHFPSIFGLHNDAPLDLAATTLAFHQITQTINQQGNHYTPHQVAQGFLAVANETMCRPIRQITSGRGVSPSDHLLFIFGGAGSQHCCSIADSLSIDTIYIHQYASILSAYGLRNAKLERVRVSVFVHNLEPAIIGSIRLLAQKIQKQNHAEINQFNEKYEIENKFELRLKYVGSDYLQSIEFDMNSSVNEIREKFNEMHKQRFGFLLDREIMIEYVKVSSFGGYKEDEEEEEVFPDVPLDQEEVPPVVHYKDLMKSVRGKCLLVMGNTTIAIEEGWFCVKSNLGNLLLHKYRKERAVESEKVERDAVELSVFSNRFMSIAEQMGKVLQNTAISTNIKERLDYSCAIFSPDGSLIANAPHMPVHLGSMSDAVKWQLENTKDWGENDVLLTNHPVAGGSHLPDLTVITPCYEAHKVQFYVASRGHHADIGGIQPGSMPSFSTHIDQEGAAIKSFKIVRDGKFQEEQLVAVLRGTRTIHDNISDLQAQIAANFKGIQLLQELVHEHGTAKVAAYMGFIQDNAEQTVRDMLLQLQESNHLPDTIIESEFMDDGSEINLKLTLDSQHRSATFDFTATSPQVISNINCPFSVTKSAVIYCLRCLVDQDIPLNQGCLRPTKILLKQGTLLDPHPDAAIVGGNVLTSQRIVDLILKAFKAAAASYGCMNNFSFGQQDKSISYYETIGGGGGAGRFFDGQSGIQAHMTNTRITDVETVERRYPVRVTQFTLREGSGGNGRHKGGEGLVREYCFLSKLQVNLLTERRVLSPFGICGGQSGSRGQNLLIKKDGRVINLGSKVSIETEVGDSIRILTPGGGGYGSAECWND